MAFSLVTGGSTKYGLGLRVYLFGVVGGGGIASGSRATCCNGCPFALRHRYCNVHDIDTDNVMTRATMATSKKLFDTFIDPRGPQMVIITAFTYTVGFWRVVSAIRYLT